MKRSILFLITLIFLLNFAGCTKKETAETEKPSVSVSILPLKYFTERICGDRYGINVLLPPGANPHMFEPQPSVIRSLAGSSALFIIGELEFEKAWLERFKSVNKDLTVVTTSEGADFVSYAGCDHEHNNHEHRHDCSHGHKHDHEHKNHDHGHDHHHDHHNHHHEGTDPHIWMSPREVKVIANNIFTYFASSDPENSEFYRNNLNAFLKDIEKLDMQIKTITQDIEAREFIIYHPALSYFARDYGLKEIAIEIDGKDPSPKQIIELINKAKEHNIKTVFVQKQFDRRAAETIAEEIGGTVTEIDHLSDDWINNLLTIARTLQLSEK